MDIKLVILDLDGTINDNWTLFDPLCEKLWELRERGVNLVVNSSRDAMGVLYFTYNAGFPFDYVCSRPSVIVSNPLDRKTVSELFDEQVVSSILAHPSPSKIERIDLLMYMCAVRPRETLFVDDGPLPEHMKQIVARDTFLVASPYSEQRDWLEYVEGRAGFVSNKPCGWGTLEVLNHYFPEE